MVFGLGTTEIIIILIIVIILFGPKKIPELARSIGMAIKGYKEEVERIEEHGTQKKAIKKKK